MPDVRVALWQRRDRVTIASGSPLAIIDPDEGRLRTVDSGVVIDARQGSAGGTIIVVASGGTSISRTVLQVVPRVRHATIRIDGREYHGRIELRADTGGLVVINRIAMDDYLAGVVGAEMGRRAPDEIEALKAQAVASRTWVIRRSSVAGERAYDVQAGSADQVYGGLLNENPLARAAVEATRGEVVTYHGEPIDAFFSSTCGGETEDGVSAFAGADRPYLRSVDDHDPQGQAWCASSPRFRWETDWSGDELASTLRRTLPAAGLPADRAEDLRAIGIERRTATGRVALLSLHGRSDVTVVRGQAIRRVLSPPEGGILASTDFTIRLTRAGGQIERLEVAGRGSGHAVGMCQWGAIGRARAGQDYRMILASYFPGTEVQRLY